MSRKLSKEELLKSLNTLKSSGEITDDEFKKICGGVNEEYIDCPLPCPHCKNIKNNVWIELYNKDPYEGLALCGKPECNSPFRVIKPVPVHVIE